MLSQFFDGGMIVVGDQVGQRQVRRIEDTRFAAEKLEQARSFLDDEPRIRAFAQGSIKEQDARCGSERAEAETGVWADIFCAQSRKVVGVGARGWGGARGR